MSDTAPTTTTSAQAATSQPTPNSGQGEGKPSVPSPSRVASKGKAAGSSQGSAPSGSAGGTDTVSRETTAPAEFNFPDELDFDTLSDETRAKLKNWKTKLKINGQERQMSVLDAMRYGQKEWAADERMQKSSQIEKQHNALIQQLRANPLGLLEQLGVPVDELSKQRIAERIQFESMSPEQQEAFRARHEAETYKQQLLQQEQERVAQQTEQAKDMARGKWEKNMLEALQKSGLPNDPLVMKLTAQFVLANRQKGFNDFTAEDAIPMVRDFCAQMARYYFNALPPADLFKELGNDFDTRIRKHLLEQVQNPIKEVFKQAPPDSTGAGTARDSKGRYLTPDQAREALRKKFG